MRNDKNKNNRNNAVKKSCEEVGQNMVGEELRSDVAAFERFIYSRFMVVR